MMASGLGKRRKIKISEDRTQACTPILMVAAQLCISSEKSFSIMSFTEAVTHKIFLLLYNCTFDEAILLAF